MSDTVYVIGAFIIGFIVVVIVSFLGNKISDGFENAIHSKKIQKQNENSKYSKTESLADRYKNLTNDSQKEHSEM